MTKTNSPTLNPDALAAHYELDGSRISQPETDSPAASPRRWMGRAAMVAAGAVLAVPTAHILVRDAKDSYHYGYHPAPAGQVHKH